MEDATKAIGVRIRTWREELGWSLQELARRAGVAASSIQKIETGHMIPSIEVLMKVARGLERTPAEFMSDEMDEDDVVLTRANHHPIARQGSELRIERLSGDLFDPAIEVWRTYIEPGVASGTAPHSYEGEEVIICEQGEVTFRFGSAEYRLRPGDTLHFKGGRPHEWWNSGKKSAQFLMAGSSARAMRKMVHDQIGECTKHREKAPA